MEEGSSKAGMTMTDASIAARSLPPLRGPPPPSGEELLHRRSLQSLAHWGSCPEGTEGAYAAASAVDLTRPNGAGLWHNHEETSSSSLMKQAQAMQEKLQEAQARLAETTVDGSAGGGMVVVTLKGSGELKGVDHRPLAAGARRGRGAVGT